MDTGSLNDLIARLLSGRRLLAHPFYRRWEAGELDRSELAAYAAQYRHVEAALPEVLATIVAALPEGRAHDLVQDNLDEELGSPLPHLALFESFAAAAGAADDEPGPATGALIDTQRASARAGAIAGLAALCAYEVQAAEIAASKAGGLRERYGFEAAGTRFWDVHATMEAEHGRWMLEALADLGATRSAVEGPAGRAADAWWAFLDERERSATRAA